MSIYSCSYNTAHYLYSMADFQGILFKMFQVSVNHIMQQMTQHTLIVNFIQYVCPLSSTTRLKKRLRVHLKG